MKGNDPLMILKEPPRVGSVEELPISWDWRDYKSTGVNLVTAVGNQMVGFLAGI